jgi:alpha/beta hydrolase family protein
MGFANDDLCNATGQKIPFPATASARMSSNDPRLSIAERYPTHANYVLEVTLDATKLAFQRFLLPEDVARYVIRAVVARVP